MSSNRGILPEFMRGQRLRYGGAIAAMAAATLLLLAVPRITQLTIDHVITGKPLGSPGLIRTVVEWLGGRSALAANLWLAGLALVSATGLAGLFTFLRGRWAATASENVALRIRNRLYDHLNRLPCSYHDKAETGDLVQRCTSDVETVRHFLGSQVVEVARAVLMVVAVLPFMLSMSVPLTGVAMICVPGIFLFGFIFFRRVKAAFKLADEAEGRMTTVLQENLTGIRVVRAFARQQHECAKFAERNAEYRDSNYRMVRLMAIYWSSSDFLCHLQSAIVLAVGAYWLIGGHITVGVLWAFFAYVNMFVWPLRQMGRILTDLGKAQVALTRIGEILHAEEEPAASREPAGSAPSDAKVSASGNTIVGAISFRDLRFGYDAADGGGKLVLNGISFDVAPGQTVALLGPSGSGKSTLVHLLLRLYDYKHGSVTIDGRELRELDRQAVRSQVAAVLQEPFLYSKTVRDNIRLGHSPAEDHEIEQAARSACVHDSIVRFDNGYATLVGERGVTLSGGQRQRVALARAILRDPPILLLDDALSAVDTQTESLILEALRSRRGRATTLVIAHRLTTLMQAEQIIVLDHGRVVQSGTHATLLDEEGLYRRLWQIQSDLAEDLDQELAGAAAK